MQKKSLKFSRWFIGGGVKKISSIMLSQKQSPRGKHMDTDLPRRMLMLRV